MDSLTESENACNKVSEVYVVPSLTKDYEDNRSNKDIYEITGPKKGLALILNNSFYDNSDIKARGGCDLDVKNMEELWTQMGCDLHEGKVHKEKTAEKMKKLLEEINDVEGYCFLVIVIMTHGGTDKKGKNYFMGSDGEHVTIKEVEELFHNSTSKSRDIPKLFILQFCRGRTVDKGVPINNLGKDLFRHSMMSFVGSLFDVVEADGAVGQSHQLKDSKIILAYATMDGFAALRNPTNGSWFINAITNVFMKHACKRHVADLLVKVQFHMQSKTGTYKKQPSKAMSKHVSNLTKDFFLFPGHPKKEN